MNKLEVCILKVRGDLIFDLFNDLHYTIFGLLCDLIMLFISKLLEKSFGHRNVNNIFMFREAKLLIWFDQNLITPNLMLSGFCGDCNYLIQVEMCI